jgi:hypothetical protein
MEKKEESIDIENTQQSTLPMGYKSIYLKKIPPFEVENKLMLYNKKYKSTTYQVASSSKPISKILK